MKVLFKTLGCKVNRYDTETLRELFACGDILSVNEGEDIPDIVVVNSCTVTAESDRKTRQTVRKMRRQYPAAVIAVTGCMPQARPEKAKTLTDADIIIGNALNSELPALVKKFMKQRDKIVESKPHRPHEKISPLSSHSFEGRTRAFVKIEDGCNRFCSYCIVPYARGRVRSKPPQRITEELTAFAAAGYKEAVVAGINLSAYGSDIGLTLPDGVKAADVEGIERLRLGSLEPDQLTPEVLDGLKSVKKLCGQFHLSLQSGSDGVLKRMNRKYDTALYRRIISDIRARFENCSVTTDIMTGFPGETEEEFNETLDFVKEIGFSKVHIFCYSRREGTPAAQMENQVDEQVKTARSKVLSKVAAKCAKDFFAAQVGRIENVLFEQQKDGFFEGYTENYTPIKVKAENGLKGEILPVKITECTDEGCFGEVVR
mgnify:FL=1